MKFAKLAFVIFAIVFASANSVAGEKESQDKIAAAVESAIAPVMREHNIAGLALAVTHRGKRYFFNYGVASKETRQPVTESTIFEIGSVSKTFTASLATYAQARGALTLTDSASKYLPALRGSSFDKISLLELGTYAAGGLPLQFPDDVDDDEKMIRYFKNWKPTFEAGTHRLYSNPSIGLFGYLVAKSMNAPFEELLEKRIFPNLGLTHTYIKVPDAQMQHYAHGYSKADKPVRVGAGMFDAEAYGVKTSSADMIQFVEANMRVVKLDPAFQSALAATQTGYFKVGPMTQALGWEWYRWPIPLDELQAGNSTQMIFEANEVKRLIPPLPSPKNTLINKTGSTNGFGAYVAFIPDKRSGIVILANRNYPIPARVKAAYAVLTALNDLADGEATAKLN